MLVCRQIYVICQEQIILFLTRKIPIVWAIFLPLLMIGQPKTDSKCWRERVERRAANELRIGFKPGTLR